MKYNLADINEMISRVNKRKGIENPAYNVVGSIKLNRAYGMFEVEEIVNTAGGTHSLSGFGTKNEIGKYLQGMLYKD